MSGDKETHMALPSTSDIEPATEPSTSAGPSSSTVTKPVKDNYIQVRVISSDDANQVNFRVKPFTDLGRLKRSYCTRLGLEISEVRFVFDGIRITDVDTPDTLGLVNDDVIEVYQEKVGGM